MGDRIIILCPSCNSTVAVSKGCLQSGQVVQARDFIPLEGQELVDGERIACKCGCLLRYKDFHPVSQQEADSLVAMADEEFLTEEHKRQIKKLAKSAVDGLVQVGQAAEAPASKIPWIPWSTYLNGDEADLPKYEPPPKREGRKGLKCNCEITLLLKAGCQCGGD